MVLVGSPGGGKSVFLARLAAALAAETLGGAAAVPGLADARAMPELD
ncbi:MAG: hypothetical protein HZA54_05230, partial [Planctomycetes bacterium]|nr:hypothetical protein [Planctomycetota bacterium]